MMKNYTLLKRSMRFFLSVAVLSIFGSQAMAQSNTTSRGYIKDCIRERGECHNVAITKTGGDAMINGRNGWCAKNCPTDFVSKLRELHDKDKPIKDIQITENGSWVILWGDNGVSWHDIPQKLEDKIRHYNDIGETINSISLNDVGDWVIVTDNYYSASSQSIMDFLREGESNHGELWTVCLTDDALAAVYENGYRWFGEVPEDCKDAAREVTFDVYRIKIAGTAWFMADKNGTYRYHM
ncbi:MAG: hypothetical protein J5848_04930 [Bacteroidales bacterium]|nr:hypothetical protein [Bacteroidales bacterium]